MLEALTAWLSYLWSEETEEVSGRRVEEAAAV